jgi:hypothetical protein
MLTVKSTNIRSSFQDFDKHPNDFRCGSPKVLNVADNQNITIYELFHQFAQSVVLLILQTVIGFLDELNAT